MPTIFISYRRADSASETGRVYDRLVERYGREHVFKDVDSIPPGVNFPDYIAESIAASDVALVVIGPRWLGASAGFAQRRLDDPADFVRIEIETALRLGVPVIPVLVGGASLPPARRLPESLRPLLTQNGLVVRQDPDFTRDLERVFHAVEYWQAQPRRAPGVNFSDDIAATIAARDVENVAPASFAERQSTPQQSMPAIASRRATRPPNRRTRAVVMSLAAALLLVAVGVATLVKGGALAALTTRAPTPNVAATRSVQAFDSQFAATETAQARYLTTPYTPTAIGPCVPASQPKLWSWSPLSAVTCATNKASVDLTNQAGLTFIGFPSTHQSFPDAFVATFDVSIKTAEPSSCAQILIGFTTANPGGDSRAISLCHDGQVYNSSAIFTPIKGLSVFAPWVVKITISKRHAAVFTVNGVTVYTISSFIGGIASLSVEGEESYPTDVITVSHFSLLPTLS